ncbi:MAG: ammonium transporter [Bradyrhizobiaceae bacterium]|nr:ammonium transporter [Bradyrhizobiaceae bacterium]
MKTASASRRILGWTAATLAGLAASPALAQGPTIDGADTAWITTATALVLLMTLPGLALLYAGMVRKKHLLAVMAQCFAAAMLVSVLWMIAGYSLTFVGGGSVIGSLDRFFLAGMSLESVNDLAANLPESLFAAFQMTFAIITVALVAGSVADRMRFSAFVLFAALWLFIVYVPIAHWVWGGGFLGEWGLLDFAGGTVVHINAGVAGLVACLVLGARHGYGSENLSPFDLSLAVIGTSLLWVGWFGFNGGSALGAGSRATMAILVTHLGASMGAIGWMAAEWWTRGKPSVLGILSGAIAGLGTITPASGFVLPWHALIIGGVAGIVCFWACTWLKQRLRYDDSLDVFGIHGVGGVIGTLATGVFAVGALSASPANPTGSPGLLEGNAAQLQTQAIGVVVTIVWCAVATFVVLKVVDLLVGLRVSPEAERMGLDVTQHGEALQ